MAIVVGTLATAATAHAEPVHVELRAVISTSVVDAIQETIGVALDYRVASRVAIRGAVGYDTRTFYDADRGWDHRGGIEATVGARVFYHAPYQGPFADAELRLRTYDTGEICNTDDADRVITACNDGWRAWSPRLLIGYQLTLRSGLSFSAAAGLGYEWAARTDGEADETSVVGAASLRVGYAF